VAPAAVAPGPRTEAVTVGSYSVVHYVDQQRGSDEAGDGSIAHPWASLTHALEQAPAPGQRCAVLVSQGRYHEPTLALKSRIDVFGGFASPGGARDVEKFATILDGGESQRIAIGADDTRIDGVQFANGRVRGKGAALLCDGVSPAVTNCVFTANRTVIPRDWEPPQLHLTANDGGAVMCLNAAAPRFEHCLFYHNSTECGRGGALACDRGAMPRIAWCVFANNRAGLDDPMRSSDGGAVSIFDRSGGEFIGNIVVANRSLTRNDAGGLFVALWSAPHLADNVIVGNDGGDDAGGLFVGGQEHRYGVPLDPYPPAARYTVVVERNVIVGNVNASRNSGALRVTMESRVRFADNVIAENIGAFYLQRSEINAERNTIWQDWRFVEDKPSLGPSRFTGNILRGPLDGKIEARATLTHNMAEPTAGGRDTLAVADVFVDDSVSGKITAIRFDPVTFTTIITTVDALPAKTNFAGRPILLGQRKNGQWHVVKTAADHTLVLWSRLEAETHPAAQFEILRSFTLKPDAPAGVGARLQP
jgi:hypothetical protein